MVVMRVSDSETGVRRDWCGVTLSSYSVVLLTLWFVLLCGSSYSVVLGGIWRALVDTELPQLDIKLQ
jgi:hypothetical protein